jgi:hypothetical protein
MSRDAATQNPHIANGQVMAAERNRDEHPYVIESIAS